MENTRLILVRHGQSIGNAKRLFLGHTDLDLSEIGYNQAEKLSQYLINNEKIDIIYSSDLIRAYNTVKSYAVLSGLSIIADKKLREAGVGDWEGKYVPDLIEEYGDAYTKEWVLGFGTFKFPGGESIFDAGHRFYNEVLRISRENTGKTVLIAAHAAVIRAFWGIISNILPEDLAESFPFPTNASCSLCYFDGEKFNPERYSVDDYLADVGITSFNG